MTTDAARVASKTPSAAASRPRSVKAQDVRHLLVAKGGSLRLPGVPGRSGGGKRRGGYDPQAVLTAALRARLGENAVLSEVVGLVPGRRYRADVVIPSAGLVIEFDGFQYHRSKTAFQKDRERQNAFVAHGWRVLRFFAAQIRSDLDGVVGQVAAIVEQNGARQHRGTTLAA